MPQHTAQMSNPSAGQARRARRLPHSRHVMGLIVTIAAAAPRIGIKNVENCRTSEELGHLPSPEADNTDNLKARTKLRRPASNGATRFERLVDFCDFDVISVINKVTYGLSGMASFHDGAQWRRGGCKQGSSSAVNHIVLR